MKKRRNPNPFNEVPLEEAKFAVVDMKSGDCFENWFATEEDAIIYADYDWGHLTPYEQKNIAYYYVAEIEYDPELEDYTEIRTIKVYK